MYRPPPLPSERTGEFSNFYWGVGGGGSVHRLLRRRPSANGIIEIPIIELDDNLILGTRARGRSSRSIMGSSQRLIIFFACVRVLAIALKYTYQLRGVNRGLLRGLTARYGQYLTHAHNHIISAVRQSRSLCLRNLLGSGAMPCSWGPNEDETAVHNCHFRGDMVVRMLKVLVIPQSKPRSWYVCFSANDWYWKKGHYKRLNRKLRMKTPWVRQPWGTQKWLSITKSLSWRVTRNQVWMDCDRTKE